MATTESIREGLDALNAALYEAQSFTQLCDELAGYEVDRRPAWVDCVVKQIGRIAAASEALETVLVTEAIPALAEGTR